MDAALFYVREILRRALELDTAAMIAVHNHPSGSPEPTAGDIDRMNELARGASTLRMTLHDHLIVSDRGIASMRSMGLLRDN